MAGGANGGTSSSKLMQYDYLVKLLLIGDSGVGKSSLLVKFAEDKFSPHIGQTIGMDFKVKMLDLGTPPKRVKLQIWDTAGQERFHTITQQYYRNAMGIILVYDVTNEDSFNNIRRWAAQIAAHGAEGADRMLLGNKCDRPERVVDEARGQALANEYGIPFMETSAKEGKNVKEAFEGIADCVRIRFQNQESVAGSSVAGGASIRLPGQAGASSADTQRKPCCG